MSDTSLKRTPAVEITVIRDSWETYRPGSFKWIVGAYQNIIGMQYKCPCGCGSVGEIRFARSGEAPLSPTYLWDGDREYPTITPGFAHVVAGQIHWSGVLQRGEFLCVMLRDDNEGRD